MLVDHHILVWHNNIGLTSDYKEVERLPKSDFPKLIFQDFMSQLKLPRLKIGFEEKTANLVQLTPENIEQIDESIRWYKDFKFALNLEDVLSYYLLTRLLKCEFKTENIFNNHNLKTEYSFKAEIPFSDNELKNEINHIIIHLISFLGLERTALIEERFFILLGDSFKDKLLLFLTYLETKYKFKTDKSAFINATLGDENLNRIKNELNNLKRKYA